MFTFLQLVMLEKYFFFLLQISLFNLLTISGKNDDLRDDFRRKLSLDSQGRGKRRQKKFKNFAFQLRRVKFISVSKTFRIKAQIFWIKFRLMWISSKCFCLYAKHPSVFTAGLSCLSLNTCRSGGVTLSHGAATFRIIWVHFQLWMAQKHKSDEFFYGFQAKEKQKKQNINKEQWLSHLFWVFIVF